MRFWLDLFSDVVAVSIGLIFGYAALAKLSSPRQLIEGVRKYELVPKAAAPIVGTSLIILEGTIAATHIGTFALPLFVPLTIGLLTVFLLVTSFLMWRRSDVPCLCFGASASKTIGGGTLYRLAFFLTAEIALLLLHMRHGAARSEVQQSELIVLVAAMLVLGYWISSAKDILVWLRASVEWNRQRSAIFK